MGIRSLNVTKNKENTIVIPLFDHEGNPIMSGINGKQARVELRSQDSREFQKALTANSAAMKKIAAGEVDTSAKQLNRSIFLTKAMVVDWFDVEDDGVEIEFTDENLDSLLRDEPHLMKQIDEAISDRAKFVKKTTDDASVTRKK